MDGGSWDPAGQSRYALPRHVCNDHLPPTRLWRAGVGEAPAVGVQRCCGPVGESRLLAIPTLASKGGPPCTASAVWVSQQKMTKKDFAVRWLTPATIKDAIWTSRNLLVSRRRQMPPVAVIRMAAATRTTSRAAGGAPRTQPPRRIACASVDEGAGATRKEVQAAAAWLSG
ncbi:uncharacterized protein LOC114153664 isoform X2 [Xiphophorus couchianus]|uniref:uncharacterized protein LOC114153664 isoform X2 n=1 Tax=Xiphophorus couchianus TaxID=32473 RepID=UPI001015D2EA|nr:uncharacterized protein LOC114153664 isoform X2 [Xiphophorus couchianus]